MFKKLFKRKSCKEISSTGSLYCPCCKSEYRSGFTQCGSCNVELVENMGKSDLTGSSVHHVLEPIKAGEVCVPFLQGPLMEMKKKKQLLASHGLATQLSGDPQQKKS